MKKRGFTLIELLAVIVILAIISLIAIPIIVNIITKAKKSAFLDSAYGIMKSAEVEYIEAVLEGKKLPTLFEYPFDQLKFRGEKPDGGKIVIDEKGNIGISIYNNKWCVKKEITEKEVSITKYENETCKLSNISELPEVIGITIEEQMEKQKDEVATLDPDGNLRYVGGNPKNYVKFNNELWRIIGIFDGEAKIIRNEFYGTGIAWDTNNTNDWSQASLQTELNSIYLNNIDEISRSYIDQNHVWNLGGGQNSIYTREQFYNYERGNNVYGGNPTTWKGSIGLMYPSDYGYATSENNCDTVMSEWSSKHFENVPCYSNDYNWLFNTSYHQWTITPIKGNSSSVIVIHLNGYTEFYGTQNVYRVYPVLYLKPNIKIKGGDGTSTAPYILVD